MQVLIIEDERPAAQRLQQLICEVRSDCEILDVIDTVEDSVNWLKSNAEPDLIFMDIQLADGQSFEIFKSVEVKAPVIFTTAFHQYMLKAFKVHSIDYLLKPVNQDELAAALQQYDDYFSEHSGGKVDATVIRQLVNGLQPKAYKERFLVKRGQQLQYIKVEDIAYFLAQDGLLYLYQNNGKKHVIDYTLDQLEEQVSPDQFYRISRKYIVSLDSIQTIHSYFNSRLKLDLAPANNNEAIVSRERVSDFKGWLDR